MWKDFFYFSRRERRGMIILAVFIAGIFTGKYLFTPKALSPVEVLETEAEQMQRQETVNVNENRTFSSDSYRPRPSENRPPDKRTYYPPAKKIPEPVRQDNFSKQEKMAEGTVIDINSSDTTGLMKVPGIGSSFARRIVGYRNILGGFYRIEQLQEVYGMYEELYGKIAPYLTVNTDSIRPIAANSAPVEKLKSHPYINFYQAKAIVETRKKKGKLDSIDELSLLEEFPGEDLERIRPYLHFD
jgi:competence ComEA-like helix-hairpin-helix protein